MTDPTTTTGEESVNAWKSCVQRDICGYIGVRPNTRKCPDCRSRLEHFHGTLYKCGTCQNEYLSHRDAKDCCQ